MAHVSCTRVGSGTVSTVQDDEVREDDRVNTHQPDPAEPRVEEIEPGTHRATLDGLSVEARLGRIHGRHGVVQLPEDATPDQLRALGHAPADAVGAPLAAKAVPGTDRHRLLTEAGATAYQVCPPSMIDCTDPANLAWARSADPGGAVVGDLRGRSAEEILGLYLDLYVWVHADWSPVMDVDHTREVFAEMLGEELDPGRSVLVEREGRPAAMGFVFPEGEGWVVVGEAVDPDAPHAAEDVLTCLQALVGRLGEDGVRELLVDGHVTDPHWYPALQQVPHVTGEGLELLELR